MGVDHITRSTVQGITMYMEVLYGGRPHHKEHCTRHHLIFNGGWCYLMETIEETGHLTVSFRAAWQLGIENVGSSHAILSSGLG